MKVDKDYVDGVVRDLVSDLLYYDRKGDEIFTRSQLETLAKTKEITPGTVIAAFAEELIKQWPR